MSNTIWQPEQVDVLEFNENKDLIVFASAGSGKTSVMVEKIVRYLESGVDVSQIIVVTFTNNSAADMRDKISEKLKERIKGAKSEDMRDHLRKQIVDLPQADIGTIDSFCNAIVQKHYEVIGVNPGLGVLSQGEETVLLLEAIQTEISEGIEREDQDLLVLGKYFSSGRNLGRLGEIIREIYYRTGAFPSQEKELKKKRESCDIDVIENKAIKRLIDNFMIRARKLKEIVQAKLSLSKELGNRYQNLINRLVEIGKEYSSMSDLCSRIEIAYSNFPVKILAAECKNKEERDRYNSAMKEVEGFINEMKTVFPDEKTVIEIETSSRKVMLLLIDLTEAVIKRFELLKKDANKMSFSDVERYALRILTEEKEGLEVPSKIAREISESKKHIFIDEYQDTNNLQEMILRRISNNNIFMVGDIKQSIYMFRNSDPDIMKEKHDSFAKFKETGESKSLNYNYRSHQKILKFVNDVFSAIMSESFGSVNYKKDSQMTAFNEFPEDKEIPPVTVKLFDKKDSEEEGGEEDPGYSVWPEVYSVSNAPRKEAKSDPEAEWVADAIVSMVGKEQIYDKKISASRKIEYKDIVLLQRNRDVKPFAEAFERKGIPYESIGGEDAIEKEDINTINCILRTISNPEQDFPLTYLMTSFFGKFSPSDLLALRTHRIKEINESETLSEIEKIQELEKINNENIYQALSSAKGEIGQKAKRLLDMIGKYRDESYLTDVASLMMRIATETGFDAEMLSTGESRISSFNTFVEFLRDKEFNKNIEAYLSWVDKDLDIEAKLPGSGSNCVRINTIHGSKGLEYPIVFFTNSDQGFKKGKINSKDILMDKDLGVATKYVDIRLRKLIQTPSYISISERLSEREKEEQMRILYVALTRAMNRLIVTGAKPPKNFDPNGRVEDISKLNCLIEYASSRYPSFREEYYDNYEPEEAAETTKELTLPEIKEGEKISFHSYEHLPATKIHNKYTVTELASTSMSMIEKNGAEEGILPNMVPYTPEQGTFYHKILEKIDFSSTTDEEIKKEIDRLYLEGIPGQGVKREEIDDSIIIRALNNKLFRDMKGKEILREQPFMMYLPYNEVIEGGTFSEEKVIVQGVIDLMSVDGEEVTLVDYKYSRSTPDAIKQRYFEQMRVYTLAIEKILKKTVLRKVIYLLSQDKVVEF